MLALTLPSLVQGQSAVLDEGTLMLTRNGSPIGRESFRVVRAPAPGGQVYRATGQSAQGDSRVTTSLSTDSSGVPVSYESEVSQRGQVVLKLTGGGRPGRFSILSQQRSGESTREYMLNSGALVIEDDVFHHFFFLPIAAAHSSVVVIVPRTSGEGHFQLEDRGPSSVEIAGRAIAGRRWALLGGPGSPREVWVDGKGRLLKVTVPDRGIVALRDDPPK